MRGTPCARRAARCFSATALAAAATALVIHPARADDAAAPTSADPALITIAGDADVANSDLIYIEADEIFADEQTGRYVARGDVEVRFGTRSLHADEVTVFPESNRVLATGDILLVDEAGVVTSADEAEFSDDLSVGVIQNLRSRLPHEGKTGASVAIRREGGANELRRAFYTVCDVCSADGEPTRPTWRLRARRVVQNESTQMLHYRDAVLEVKGVPVFYAPYFAHADPSSERRSGFLLPYFGESSRTGAFYEQPYYWAISPSQDLTIAPRVMTAASPLVALEHRKKFFSGGSIIQGSLTHEQEFDDDGNKFGEERWRGHIFANAQFALSDQWMWGLGVERVSDDLYFRRYEIDDADQSRGLFRRGSKRLLSQAYIEGHSHDFHASLATLAYQGLRAGDDEDQFPLLLPLGEYRRRLSRDVLGGRVDGRVSTAVIERTDGVDSRRVSAELDWRRQFITPLGVVAEPFAFGRADVYSIGDYTTPGGEPVNEVIERGLGYVGAEVSWPFGRTAGKFDLIVEPLSNVVVSPVGGNDERIPNSDSLITELDEVNLLNPNRSPGFDIWEDGSRAVVGARAIARWAATSEASLFLGQSYRSEEAIEFSESSGLDGDRSDIVGAAELSLSPRRAVAARFRLDDDDLDIRRLDLNALFGVGPASLSTRYLRFTDDLVTTAPREEISLTAGVEFTDHLGAYYQSTTDLVADETRYSFFGFVYNDDCARFEFIYKRDNTRDRALSEGDSFRFQFTLTSIGTFGSGG